MKSKTLLTVRQLVAELLDTNGTVNRSQLAAMTGISYSRVCAVINQFPEYFDEPQPGDIRAAVTSIDDIKISKNEGHANNTKAKREARFETNLLEQVERIANALEGTVGSDINGTSKDNNNSKPVDNNGIKLTKKEKTFLKLYRELDDRFRRAGKGSNIDLMDIRSRTYYRGKMIEASEMDMIGILILALVEQANITLKKFQDNVWE